MIFIAGYKIHKTIHEGNRSLVYRAERQLDRQPAIVKVPRKDSPNYLLYLSRLKHEYTIAKNIDAIGLIKIYELVATSEGIPALVLEDFGGQSLHHFLAENRLSCLEFLNLAIQIANSLEQLHQLQIIHKDINPSNILINPMTNTVKIIDFGSAAIAERNSNHFNHLSYSRSISGTLAYMSPEQTGRMNRGVDYRTDFYSLGMTFYQMLTGILPFQATDPLEWIYCHIAKTPKFPHDEHSKIFHAVSHIILKLLAKNAEDRYQSISGLTADLEICLDQLVFTGKVTNFPLGEQDIACQFQIPQKLYGRQKELATLMAAFNQVNPASHAIAHRTNDGNQQTEESTQLILISGYCGIGKSALVREIYQPIVANQGYFISDKFDRYQRNVPYSAWINALRQLIRLVLTERDARIQEGWRENIIAKLGDRIGSIVKAIPELKQAIDPLPIENWQAVTRSQQPDHRFDVILLQLISIFSQERPLVIFLDDLHWADPASLKLLEGLMTDCDRPLMASDIETRESIEIVRNRSLSVKLASVNSAQEFSVTLEKTFDRPRHLLIVGAYQDRNLGATDTWSLTLNHLRSLPDRVTEIKLRPLSIDAIAELIADTVQSSPEWSQPLAEFFFHKTQGNPFFLKQLLQSLYQQHLLTYNREIGRWQWDLQQIEAIDFTNDVVQFLLKKLHQLPEHTLDLLKLAACIGDRFDLEFLAQVNRTSINLISQHIQPAVRSELIVPIGHDPDPALSVDRTITSPSNVLSARKSPALNGNKIERRELVYKFLHDRVKQAVYSLMTAQESADLHLKIGQILLQVTPTDRQYQKIFTIVNQLNLGENLITEVEEKDRLASLNLIAGQKAKETSAYGAALEYLITGLNLLSEASWETHYDLTLILHIETIQAAYLNQEYERVNPLAETVLQRAKTTLERVKVYELQILLFIDRNELERAVQTGLTALQELKITLPENPTKLTEIWQGLQIKWALRDRPIDRLSQLPLMTDPLQLAAMGILVSLIAPTSRLNPRLFWLVAIAMVKLSLKEGNSPFAAVGYGVYGAILCASGNDVDLGYEFGQLSLKLLEKFEAVELKAKVHKIVHAQIDVARVPLQDTIAPLRKTVQWGLETGDFQYASYAARDYCLHQLFLGNNLFYVCEQFTEWFELLDRLSGAIGDDLQRWKNVCTALTVESDRNSARSTSDNVEEHAKTLRSNAPPSRILATIMEAYLWQKPEMAIELIQPSLFAQPNADLLEQVQLNFYSSLVLLMQARRLPTQQRHTLLKTVTVNQRKLKSWASDAPYNFQHKYDLVAAETARLLGNANQAIAAYERAITGAREQGYLHEAAIANHRAGEFYRESGSETIAQLYLHDAHDGYLNWGAIALANHLQRDYPQVFSSPTNDAIALNPDSTNRAIDPTATNTNSSSLDLSTAIEAAKALANEKKLDHLLDNLMKIVMENAGATSACLIWDSDGTWVIKARAILDSEQTIIGDRTTVETSEHLPISVIKYVAKTRKDVMFDRTTIDERFRSDPYIETHQPQSVLCVAIVHQDTLIGLLYLENHLTTGAFSPERLEIVKLLSYLAAISLDNAELHRNLAIREKRLRRQSSTLLKLSQRNRQQASPDFRKATSLLQDVFGLLTRNYSDSDANKTIDNSHSQLSDDLLASIKEIIEASANTLLMERVSVWLYNDLRTNLKCLYLYELSLKRHSCSMELDVCDYPTYFRVLSTERPIAAHDARQDLRTAEFRDTYLIPLGITSMLAAPIRVSGQMVGILCHEHIGPSRHWTIEEENFAASLADLIALAIERFYRAKAEQERDRFFSLSQDLLCVMDFEGKFTQLNPAWENTLAFSSEQMLDKSFIQFVHPDDREASVLAAEKLVSQQEIITFENRYRCADGSYRWLFWNATPDLERQLIYAVVHDITYRVEAEAALKQANERLEMRVGERTAELQQAISSLQNTNQQLHDEITFRTRTEEALRHSQAQLKEQTKELQEALDQLQRTQIQLVQNEKMASLGQLVAGIAHEINNPVSFIYSNIDPLTHYIEDLLHFLDLYQQEYPEITPAIEEEQEAIELDFLIEDIPRLLDSMKSGADRIRKIVLSLRNFSRLDEAEHKSVDLHEGIESTLLILQNQLKDIEVMTEFGELPKIDCYSAQINQVFMNIITNSIDALKGKFDRVTEPDSTRSLPAIASPKITIRTERTNSDRVTITIADNGLGIPAHIKTRVFDPFFTTKPVGSGTGLGLCVSYQIVVEKHHGKLWCESEPGQGTEFAIELPICLSN